MAKKLWGITSTSVDVVKIYLDSDLTQAAETDSESISVRPDVARCPLSWDETLMHEFVHVLEWHFAKELKAKPPKDCSNEAVIFGRELTRMLRQLRQVSPSEVAAEDPAGRTLSAA